MAFEVTPSMLRGSRPVIGNVQRLRAYLRKLRMGKCTTVVILGGSVTMGHNGGGRDKAYPARWMEWLNERYPCYHYHNDNNSSSSSSSSSDVTNRTVGLGVNKGGGGNDNDDSNNSSSEGNGNTSGSGGSGAEEEKKKKKKEKGRHLYVRPHGMNSVEFFAGSTALNSLDVIDMMFVEFNINDSFLHGFPHALEDKGSPMGETQEYLNCWYFEALLRRLLLMRKPDPFAIVVFNADYVGRTWAMPPLYDPEDGRKLLFRRNQEPLKNWVASMYEVPVFSAVSWMLPLAGKRGVESQFDKKKIKKKEKLLSSSSNNNNTNPYNTADWHSDRCCHPHPEGHLLLSLVLAHCMHEEERIMLAYDDDDDDGRGRRRIDGDYAEGQRDLTADDVPILREPMYLSPEEDETYVRGEMTYTGYDFADPSEGRESWEGRIVANAGWTWYADNVDGDKYGLIADGVAGGQHVAMPVTGGPRGRVELLFVVSYENFGVSYAWLDDVAEENVHERGLCNETVEDVTQLKISTTPRPLVAMWDQRASVPTVEVLKKDTLDEGEEKILHICLTPRSDCNRQGAGNKFKLLGVRVY